MFKLIRVENGRMPVPEASYYWASADVKEGQALVLNSSGLLAACGTSKPTFIAMADGFKASTERKPEERVAVARIQSNQLYEAEKSGSLSVGATVAVGTDGLVKAYVSGTTSQACVFIEAIEGDKAIVRII